ncbi:MAG: extensin family protein [Pseudomonadota bacterium]
MSALRFVFLSILLCVVLGLGYLTLSNPTSPVPRQWNPLKRLYVADPVTFLTPYKLDAAANDPAVCLEVLGDAQAAFAQMPDLEVSDQCGIANRVSLSRLGPARLRPVETTCAVALRMKMWERHSLQGLAQKHLDTSITSIGHLSSYNCRPIRGSSTQMSLHATAEAIDIVGFGLADGRQLSLIADWDREAAFFRDVRDTACRWFKTVLSPDYNALHANHFHLQSRGWGTCR